MCRPARLLSLVVCLAAFVVCVPSVALEVPERVAAYKLVRIKHSPDSWLMVDPVGTGVEPDISATDKPDVSIFVGPPGRYRIRELYIIDGRKGIDQAFVTIGKGSTPDPRPDPDDDGDNEPDTDPLPKTKYDVGPAVARAWQSGLTAAERGKIATAFLDVGIQLREARIPTVQQGVTTIQSRLSELNSGNKLQAGYAQFITTMQKAFDANKVRTRPEYGAAYIEIADWLKK